MGADLCVMNDSPRILLGKTQHLDLLAALEDTLVVSQAVAMEVGAKPDGAAILGELGANSAYRVFASEPHLLKCLRGIWAPVRRRSSPNCTPTWRHQGSSRRLGSAMLRQGDGAKGHRDARRRRPRQDLWADPPGGACS